jgi:hypothetical protein
MEFHIQIWVEKVLVDQSAYYKQIIVTYSLNVKNDF